MEIQPPQVKQEKKINIQMPPLKLLLVNPTDLILTPAKFPTIRGILAHMYAFNHAIAYPPSLHISRTNDIKIIPDHCCLRLPVKDEGNKKGFKIYYSEEMLNRHQKVEVVNYPKNWS